MTAKLHRCAAEGCIKQIAVNLLMCMPHWRSVPRPLQRQVYRTWRAWINSPAAKVDIRPDPSYLSAVKDAVSAVREKEIRRALKNQQHGDNLAFE